MKDNKYAVLVAEDDPKLRETLTEYLHINDYEVYTARDGEEALELFVKNFHVIDLLLLDIMLPFVDGIQVLKTIREYSKVPVIMITSLGTEEDQMEGLSCGADKYIVKPFRLRLLKAHMEALLLRAYDMSEEIVFGDLRVDLKSNMLYIKERAVPLTPKEFSLLTFFIQNKNQVLSREAILNGVWGYDYDGDPRTVDTLVKQLRKKLADECPYLHSVYGVGYCFREDTADNRQQDLPEG